MLAYIPAPWILWDIQWFKPVLRRVKPAFSWSWQGKVPVTSELPGRTARQGGVTWLGWFLK